MTPSDICIVTVRDEPGVRYGDGFYDDVPVFKNIEAIVEKEKLKPDEFHWEKLMVRYSREIKKQENDGEEPGPGRPRGEVYNSFPFRKNPTIALRKPR